MGRDGATAVLTAPELGRGGRGRQVGFSVKLDLNVGVPQWVAWRLRVGRERSERRPGSHQSGHCMPFFGVVCVMMKIVFFIKFLPKNCYPICKAKG